MARGRLTRIGLAVFGKSSCSVGYGTAMSSEHERRRAPGVETCSAPDCDGRGSRRGPPGRGWNETGHPVRGSAVVRSALE